MLLSPTRTYSPIIKKVLEKHRKNISGIIHCTGGGQTKVLNFLNNHRVIKNNLFEVPEIFKIIHEDTGCTLKEMYQVFNMGHRMEVYCKKELSESIIQISKEFDVDAKVIGHVEKSSKNELIIESENSSIKY